MKQLLWKEWMELRYVPLVTPALFALLTYFGHVIGSGWNLESFNAMMPYCALAGVLAGCGSFSSEVGSGTLSFITSLPVSRKQIWLAKFSAGLIAIAISIAGAFVVFVLIAALYHHPKSVETGLANGTWYLSVGYILWLFALSLAVSPLVDRSLTSLALSIIGGLALSTVFFNLIDPDKYAQPATLILTVLLFALSGFSSIVASYRTFIQGDTLRTDRRFYLAGTVFLICLAVIYVGLLIVSHLFVS